MCVISQCVKTMREKNKALSRGENIVVLFSILSPHPLTLSLTPTQLYSLLFFSSAFFFSFWFVYFRFLFYSIFFVQHLVIHFFFIFSYCLFLVTFYLSLHHDLFFFPVLTLYISLGHFVFLTTCLLSSSPRPVCLPQRLLSVLLTVSLFSSRPPLSLSICPSCLSYYLHHVFPRSSCSLPLRLFMSAAPSAFCLPLFGFPLGSSTSR